jgi:DNA mismatch endonuclease (patch repair protein)
MTDVHDKKTRSYNMSRIRSKDTKPEIMVRKFLHSRGLGIDFMIIDYRGNLI